MKPEVAAAIASGLEGVATSTTPLHVIWHGGEPLAIGVSRFCALLAAFEPLRERGLISHSLQTNACLVDDSWCDTFAEFEIEVGVSIDGPFTYNRHRKKRSGATSFSDTLQGISLLRDRGFALHVISVVSEPSAQTARALYTFACDQGFASLGVNLQETEGGNRAPHVSENNVTAFWAELLKAWDEEPAVPVREVHRVLSWLGSKGSIRARNSLNPTVDWSGRVSFLSPELQNHDGGMYDTFIVGNVLDEPLSRIIEQARNALYVRHYMDGVAQCEHECRYFTFCGGGEAGNKFFELGTMLGTETTHCRQTKKLLVESIQHYVGGQ